LLFDHDLWELIRFWQFTSTHHTKIDSMRPSLRRYFAGRPWQFSLKLKKQPAGRTHNFDGAGQSALDC